MHCIDCTAVQIAPHLFSQQAQGTLKPCSGTLDPDATMQSMSVCFHNKALLCYFDQLF